MFRFDLRLSRKKVPGFCKFVQLSRVGSGVPVAFEPGSQGNSEYHPLPVAIMSKPWTTTLKRDKVTRRVLVTENDLKTILDSLILCAESGVGS